MEHYKNKNLEDLEEIVDGSVIKEQWKVIPNHEGYAASNFGRIKSLARTVHHPRYGNQRVQEKILSLMIDSRTKCVTVQLSKQGIRSKTFKVHQIVASLFLTKPEDKCEVNHMQGNRKHNMVWLLEYITPSENVLHSYRVLGRKPSMLGRNGFENPHSKGVICLTTDIAYGSSSDAAEKTGCSASKVRDCCRGEIKQTKGLQFTYGFKKLDKTF